MGRKRLFEIDEALDAAMREFWLKGYEGTSLSDLTNAIGIGKPSLYRFFGNKADLFAKALQYYEERYLDFIGKAIAAPTALEVARRLLNGLIIVITLPGMPRGALDLNAGIACSVECDEIRQKLIDWRAGYEDALNRRFARARRSGDLDKKVRSRPLARYLMSVCAGIALQAKAGASRATLHEIAEIALLPIALATTTEAGEP